MYTDHFLVIIINNTKFISLHCSDPPPPPKKWGVYDFGFLESWKRGFGYFRDLSGGCHFVGELLFSGVRSSEKISPAAGC